MSFGGRRIDLGPAFGADGEDAAARERQEAEAAQEAARLADWLADGSAGARSAAGDPEERHGLDSRTATERELMLGSSFSLTAVAPGSGGGSVSLWGRSAVSRFDGREGRMTLDGEVASGLVGADWSRDPTTVGLIVGHSRGEGGYRSEAGNGTVSSALSGVYPWGSHALSEGIEVWGALGYGEGTLTLTPDGQSALRTDLDLAMGAVGLRGVVVEAPETGGPELAVKTDAFAVRTTTAKVRGLSAAKAEVTRLRLGLEGSWAVGFEGGRTLVPSLEAGVRHDGGDAETGYGADVGGGIAWSDPARGLSAEVRGRGLLSHEAGGFRESGISGSLAFDPTPSSARGLALTLSQTMGGEAAGGANALLERSTLAGLGADDEDTLSARRLDARINYGFGVFGDRFTAVPELGLELADAGRDYRISWRLVELVPADLTFELGLEGTRREAAGGSTGTAHSIGMDAGWRLDGKGSTFFELRVEVARIVAANDEAPTDGRIGIRVGARW